MQSNLGISVREMLTDSYFMNTEVLAGEAGLDSMISTVNVMEVPDIINWVKPGEFILTTAYSIRDDIRLLNELIPEMKSKAVTCIGIKTQRYVEELPGSVLDTADREHFPVIRIPMEMSFGDVIGRVLTMIVNRQTNQLLQIDSFNNHVKDIMLRGGDLHEIAKMIHDVLKVPLAITEDIFNDYVVVAPTRIKRELELIIEERVLGMGKESKPLRQQRYSDMVDGRALSRIMIPIYSSEMLYGHVVIWDVESSLKKGDLFTVEAATSLIALNSSRKLSVYDNENKHKVEFIQELLSADENEQDRALDKANYFQFNKAHQHGVMIAKIHGLQEMVLTPNNSKILKQLESRLISIVKRIRRHHEGDFIYANKSDRVLFLLGYEKELTLEQVREKMHEFGEMIYRYTRREGILERVLIGIGRCYADYRDLHYSLREAERAISWLKMSPEKNLAHFDELGIYRILSHEQILPDLEQFALEVLGPIIDYDRERGADLLKTLKVYFECGGNIKKVSAEMFTHYNTIIYRMQRIREIGNFNLEDSDTVLNLHIALKILDILKQEG